MSRGYILVVDDEVSILQTLRRALVLEGYDVHVAGGFGLASEKLDRHAYDLVLLDVALPDGDGLGLLERLRASGNDTPVVMMSGHATIDVAVRATRLGARDFLEKPLSTDRLLLVVENLLRLARAEAEASALLAESGLQGELLGSTPEMVVLREQIARAARANATVIVRGERGTGKELVARAIHRQSKRAAGPLEKLNCAAIPGELIESELFGHEAGAFTGATKQRRGKFERASGGTLFLDEVGDMPPAMQAKLLRVLQEGEIERVGGNETLQVDVRVVAATNRDLEAACDAGAFRADLFDRLNVLPLTLPPLRARRGDIPELARHFLARAAASNGVPEPRLDESAAVALGDYDFPGNVRELRNVIERLVILTPDATIDGDDVRACLGAVEARRARGLYRRGASLRELLDDAERSILVEALRDHGGQMTATARSLELERSHLYKKCKALGLRE
ncbi:MAG: sigma-54-dependent Fis family transcriptional regulator [Deltaproteobacteria bacterium]|nr:sigma-54-dependent Fis family transcriptional regulator [Deltaproteobacteria bacterium]